MSAPPPITAIVPVASEPRCAPASIPRTRPEATTNPAAPRSLVMRSANLIPSAEALRAPTTATLSRFRSSVRPRTVSKGGGGSIPRSPSGKSGSMAQRTRPPSAVTASISRLASASDGIRRPPPPFRASLGAASSAARGSGNLSISAAKVEGPMPSVRASRSQAKLAVAEHAARSRHDAPMRGSMPA
jgi:hypothetical protein